MRYKQTPRLIHTDHHIDDGVFDGLEEPDGSVKLLPDFGILRGSLGATRLLSHIGCYKRCRQVRRREGTMPPPFSVNRIAVAELGSTCAWSRVRSIRSLWIATSGCERRLRHKDRFLIQQR